MHANTIIVDHPLGVSMGMAYNAYDDWAGLRGYVQFINTHPHTHTPIISETFYFCYLSPIQQTMSGIGHGVS